MKLRLAIACVVLSPVACDARASTQLRAGARHAAEVVLAAMSRDRADAGRYPQRLDALSPR